MCPKLMEHYLDFKMKKCIGFDYEFFKETNYCSTAKPCGSRNVFLLAARNCKYSNIFGHIPNSRSRRHELYENSMGKRVPLFFFCKNVAIVSCYDMQETNLFKSICYFSVLCWIIISFSLFYLERLEIESLVSSMRANSFLTTEYIRVIVALLELWSALTALILIPFAVSYTKQDVIDWSKRRVTCRAINQLIKYTGDKQRAIDICFKMDKPEQYFMPHCSSAFCSNGMGF